MNLKQDFFDPIAKHIKEHVARLEPLLAHAGAGNESWLKSEATYALKLAGFPIRSMHGKGPDLRIYDGSLIELKSGIGWNVGYVRNGLKYQIPCLFLIGGPCGGSKRFMEQLERHACMIASDRYSFDTGEWVLGLIKPLGPTHRDSSGL